MYILDEQGEPRVEPDLMIWSKWFAEDERRLVRKNSFYVGDDEVTVSTVFLGLDHGWACDKPPVLWETMVFGGEHDQDQWRHRSREDAVRVHEQLVTDLMDGA